MRSFLTLLLLLSVTGCPARSHDKADPSLSACRKFGDRCEFLPGKLGSCVVRDGCTGTGSECFVCQSQH